MTFSLTDIAAIDEIFTEDCVFYEPRGVYRGRDEIDFRLARDTPKIGFHLLIARCLLTRVTRSAVQ